MLRCVPPHPPRHRSPQSATRCVSESPLPSAPPLSPAEAAAQIRRRALELGFDAVGIAAVTPLEATTHYEAWLAAGRHGEMRYLATDQHRERRAHPELVLAGLRSIVCVALCHEPQSDEARSQRL